MVKFQGGMNGEISRGGMNGEISRGGIDCHSKGEVKKFPFYISSVPTSTRDFLDSETAMAANGERWLQVM